MVCLLSLEAGALGILQSRRPWCTVSRQELCQACPAVWRDLRHVMSLDRQDCCPLRVSQCVLRCAVLSCSCRGGLGESRYGSAIERLEEGDPSSDHT